LNIYGSVFFWIFFSVLMTYPRPQGGHQEDAEEFFGFDLDELEEELLAMLAAGSASPPGSMNPTTNKHAVAKHGGWSTTASTSITITSTSAANAAGAGAAASTTTEPESVASYDDGDGDGGWLEVGKRSRTVVTRTVGLFLPCS